MLRSIKKLFAAVFDTSNSVQEARREIAALSKSVSDVQQLLEHSRTDQSAELARIVAAITGLEERAEARLAAESGSLLASACKVATDQKALLNHVSRSIARNGPITVAFIIHNMSAWDSVADLIEGMRADARFKVVVFSVDPLNVVGAPGYSPGAVSSRLTALNVRHVRLEKLGTSEILPLLTALGPEVIFRQSHWDRDIPDELSSINLNFSKIAYVSYEMMTLLQNEAMSGGLVNEVMDDEFHRVAWRVFCANQFEKRLYERHNLKGSSHVVITGHPKSERLLRRAAETEAEHDPMQGAIIWAPHHTIDDHWFKFGTFHYTHRDMLELAREAREQSFVLAPHPSLAAAVDRDFGEGYYRAFVDEWLGLGNTSTFSGGDYGPLFGASSALITDGISWLVEYQLFNKPLIYIERDGHVPFNEIGQVASVGWYVARSISEAKALLSNVMAADKDFKAEARRHVIDQLLAPGRPVENIINEIVGELRGQKS